MSASSKEKVPFKTEIECSRSLMGWKLRVEFK